MKTLTTFVLAAALVTAYSITARDCESEKGEVFMRCGTACPNTCDNYYEIRVCAHQCVVGCFCPRGTVRRESDDHCVDREDC